MGKLRIFELIAGIILVAVAMPSLIERLPSILAFILLFFGCLSIGLGAGK